MHLILFLWYPTVMRGIALLAMIVATEMKRAYETTAATTTNPRWVNLSGGTAGVGTMTIDTIEGRSRGE